MANNKTINVKGIEISIIQKSNEDFISLTDMVKGFDDGLVLIEKWLRNKNSIEFIGIWEQLYNPTFNSPEFEGIKNEAGLNRFTLSVKKWIEKTNAIGIIAKTGRYGSGTFAHRDIAFEFGSWLSPEFKLYLIREFQRLKAEETSIQNLEWNVQRTLAKVNYHIHTDAIKEMLVPKVLNKTEVSFVYANEADILNMALFGTTAKQWRASNPKLEGNIRDAATLEQLVVLSNLESINAVLILQEKATAKRLEQLNTIAISQMKSLLNNKSLKKLKKLK
jgi:KilA-N domain